MKASVRTSCSTVLCAIFCVAVLLHGELARSQGTNKRCYTVEESLMNLHNPKLPPKIKPIKHCYSDKDHPFRYSILDIPVSLALGTVRTPEFSPRETSGHWILLEVEKPLPTPQLGCMMAVDSDSPESLEKCPLSDRLLRADWTVWEDGKIASNGSSTTHADGIWAPDNIFKFLGGFPARIGHKYVLEVKLTKDGTPLNAANPHLIVTKIGDQ